MRKKIKCEICGLKESNILHRHHIIPRCDSRCTNHDKNIAILCPNCHTKVHTGDFIILGLYSSTEQKTLVWYKRGENPPIPESCWLVKNNNLVTTLLDGKQDDFPDAILKK